MADRTALRRGLRWGVPAVLVLAVLAWFAVRAVSASGAEADRYATTTVGTGSVTQTYAGSGTVTEVKQASATFPASGTVTSVDVAVGDEVEAGDDLAAIDDTALRIAVVQAKLTLAEAKVSLETAEDAAEASASAAASASASATAGPTATAQASAAQPTGTAPTRTTQPQPTPTATATAPGGTPTGGPGGGSTTSLPALSRAVVEAQARLVRLDQEVVTRLVAQQAECAPLSVTPSPTPSASATPTVSASPTPTVTASPTASATPTGTATPSATATTSASATPSTTATPSATATPSPVASVDPATLSACIAAVVTLQQAQVADAAQRTMYDTAVNALVTAASTTSGTGGGSTPGGGSSPGGTGGGTRGSDGGSTGTGTGSRGTGRTQASGSQLTTSANLSRAADAGRGGQTATVAAAEASVTKAQLALDAAEAQLEAATMTAPISGVVSAVPFAKGDTATTSEAVTVIGSGAVSVQMAVPEAAFRILAVGQRVTLTTPGGGRAAGRVSQRGLLPDDSTTGATTYPVTVTASGTDARSLPSGATASLSVTVASADDATVVPVSALTRSGSSGTVQVLVDGAVSRKQVTLGVIGTSTVQVLDGLVPGQVLVIADNTTALPTTSANRGARALSGGGGPGPGGGAPPGGR